MNPAATDPGNPRSAGAGRPWYLNTDGHKWRTVPSPHRPYRFHRSIAGYLPTPLVDLPDLAATSDSPAGSLRTSRTGLT